MKPYTPDDLVLVSPTKEELERLAKTPDVVVRAKFQNKSHNGTTECSIAVRHIISGKVKEELASISRQVFEQESKPEIEKLRQDVEFLLTERDKAHRALWKFKSFDLRYGNPFRSRRKRNIPESISKVLNETVGRELLGAIRSDFGRDLEKKLFQEEQKRRKLERDSKAKES